jgi:hypothetical protein
MFEAFLRQVVDGSAGSRQVTETEQTLVAAQ